MPSLAIGVDLGGTNLRIAAIDESAKLLEKVTTGTAVAKGRDHVVEEMCAAIRELTGKFRDAGSLAGIGIGVPGIIDIEAGLLRESPNLPAWRDYPVRDEIERRLGVRVILENDANAAALGEQWQGAGREAASMGMITLGTGVGGGLVLDGEIWHGMTGMAAELGHITIDPEGPLCGCGNRGCVEQYASAKAIKRMAVEAIASGKAPELARAMKDDPEFSAKGVYQMSVQGDEPAKKIFRRVGWAMGVLVADLTNIFNLPMMVVGGGVASAWEAFAPTLLAEVEKRSYIYRATRPEASRSAHKSTLVTRALLGSDAGLYGAARIPLSVLATKERAATRHS